MKHIDNVNQVREKIESMLFEYPNVNGIGVGFKVTEGKMTNEIVIRVYVDKKTDKLPIDKQIPVSIEGIKTDVIQQSRYADAFSANNICPDNNEIIGGIDIGFPTDPFYGTIGTIVRDNLTGEFMLLSCHHVLGQGILRNLGNDVTHPHGTSRKIARVYRTSITESVDAGVARLYDQLGFKCCINSIGPITDYVDDEEVKEIMDKKGRIPVKKKGAATGVTTGYIVSNNETRHVDYRPYGLGIQTMRRQIRVESDTGLPFSAGGDSGSCVLDYQNRVLGLLIGGNAESTQANRIQEVSTELNISFCLG